MKEKILIFLVHHMSTTKIFGDKTAVGSATCRPAPNEEI